jgi:hypothetical protein
MDEPRLQLFRVECKGCNGVTAGFVPAYSADEAINQARATSAQVRSQHPEIADPFQEPGALVRVGTFEEPPSAEMRFGDWSPLPK